MNKNTIKYYSTNKKAPEVTFREALLKGLAPDGGLYLPSEIPLLNTDELKSLSGKEYYEIAHLLLNKFISDEIDSKTLLNICAKSYDFDVPLEKVTDRKYIMRLDQGPTASFKDFAARMMSRLMQHFLSANNQYLTILTATSGDTGGAVANAFFGLENIKVIILFPEKEVTPMQRRQMTTLEGNILPVSVAGKFDDCQGMVKKAFLDPALSHIPLSSANSINIGRLLPQTVYYFYAWSRLSAHPDEQIVFSVPSGNFGNLMGGLIASRMGLPVKKFIVATNENNEVPEFLRDGIYKPVTPSKNCISSAMNVGHPSNLARIIDLFGGAMDETGKFTRQPDLKRMQNILYGISISDAETSETMVDIYRKHKILLEPHGAVAWQGIKKYLNSGDTSQPAKNLFVSLETANPAKFSEEMQHIINFSPVLPPSLKGLYELRENYLSAENDYDILKSIIIKHTKPV